MDTDGWRGLGFHYGVQAGGGVFLFFLLFSMGSKIRIDNKSVCNHRVKAMSYDPAALEWRTNREASG